MANKILILGGAGNLGSFLTKTFPEVISYDKEDLDVTNFELVKAELKKLAPELKLIVNCVAYNDVDGAEENKEAAVLLNVKVPENLARITKELNIPFVHFSTGYVFDGSKLEYEETDTPSPQSVYAQSKAEGESAVLKENSNSYIVRVNALFGYQGTSEKAKPSVVDIMYRIGKEKKFLKGITDEVNSFTYIPDLAASLKNIIDNNLPYGIYHIVNSGQGSWYDLAKQIFVSAGWQVNEKNEPSSEEKVINIEKIVGSQYPRPAKRPAYAVLKNTKLPKLRPWQEALSEYLLNK